MLLYMASKVAVGITTCASFIDCYYPEIGSTSERVVVIGIAGSRNDNQQVSSAQYI